MSEVDPPDPTTRQYPRHAACVEAWPDCREGEYNPYCCRFPKSCRCDVGEPWQLTVKRLERDR